MTSRLCSQQSLISKLTSNNVKPEKRVADAVQKVLDAHKEFKKKIRGVHKMQLDEVAKKKEIEKFEKIFRSVLSDLSLNKDW